MISNVFNMVEVVYCWSNINQICCYINFLTKLLCMRLWSYMPVEAFIQVEIQYHVEKVGTPQKSFM